MGRIRTDRIVGFPDLRLAVPFEQLASRKISIVYGLDALLVVW
ncbi:hypothetical protein [Microbispora rosea]